MPNFRYLDDGYLRPSVSQITMSLKKVPARRNSALNGRFL
ncbi:hypothetical protein EPIR_3125 [Erwinia piriflorinigrans CFBP 5888]|uniref:Uncharacterized protein n=1 Tax=Erwinia piriflorinigrans CFBP 5888 TaxID=1161919 RepID=V5ZAV3_9GAMM|nr:hypothetical protein EPIR_3125 [Erwinia piriflorinigrans CFBP 5888]